MPLLHVNLLEPENDYIASKPSEIMGQRTLRGHMSWQNDLLCSVPNARMRLVNGGGRSDVRVPVAYRDGKGSLQLYHRFTGQINDPRQIGLPYFVTEPRALSSTSPLCLKEMWK